MTTKTLDFTSLSVADPASPPSGYTQPTGSNNARIFNTGTKEWVSTGTQAVWYDNTTLTGTVISSTVKIGTATDRSSGPCLVDASGNGVMIITNNGASAFRPYLVVNCQLSGSPLVTALNIPSVTNQIVALERNTGTNLYTMYVNGAPVGTFTSSVYDPRYAGAVSRTGYIRELSSEYTPAQTITSINGGNPITSSQSAVAAVTTGFTGLPTTITTNATGVTCGTISGTTNAPTWAQTVRTDGAVFPKSGTVVTYTFTNGAETASGNQTINKDADQTAVIVASPINDDTTCLFGAIFATTGRSAANGDEVYHTVPVSMSDLVINPDGTMEVTNEGTFDCWVWTAATGVNYYYSVTITESGAVVVPPTTRPLGGRPVRSSLGRQIWPITPHATNPVGGSGETKKAYGIKVSGAGTVVIRTEGGDEDVTITLAAGATLPVVVTHVRDTSTATGILGYSIF